MNIEDLSIDAIEDQLKAEGITNLRYRTGISAKSGKPWKAQEFKFGPLTRVSGFINQDKLTGAPWISDYQYSSQEKTPAKDANGNPILDHVSRKPAMVLEFRSVTVSKDISDTAKTLLQQHLQMSSSLDDTSDESNTAT